MKQLLLIATFSLTFFVSFPSSSQTYKVDEKRVYSWNGAPDWLQTFTEQYTYANGGNKETKILGLNFPSLENLYQNNKTYNANNNIIMDVSFFWDNISMLWIETYRDTYDYNGAGNLITETSQTYNLVTMVYENNYRDMYEYSGNDVIKQTIQNWNSVTGMWDNDELFELSYMSPGNPSQAFYSEWNVNTSMWEVYEIDTATYDMGLISEILTEAPDGLGGWEVDYRTTFTYTNGLETELLVQNWDGTDWIDEDRDSSTYDANGNKTVYTFESWNMGAWEPYYKEEKTYSLAGALSLQSLDNENFKVFPNPASDVLNISSSVTINKMEMFNVLGDKIMQSSKTNQLNIERLKPGIYLLKIFNNNRSTTKKVVIN